MPTIAWCHWYHITGATYGTWLPGDPRGHRTRHHREHIDGDDKNPPPRGSGATKLERSQSLLKRAPVSLTIDARHLACEKMAEAFEHHGVKLAAIAISAMHYHILAQFPDDNPRKHTGIAKKHSARALSQQGLIPEGGAWAKRSRALPINDAAHFQTAKRYIQRHESQGAVVWPRIEEP